MNYFEIFDYLRSMTVVGVGDEKVGDYSYEQDYLQLHCLMGQFVEVDLDLIVGNKYVEVDIKNYLMVVEVQMEIEVQGLENRNLRLYQDEVWVIDDYEVKFVAVVVAAAVAEFENKHVEGFGYFD